MKLGQGERKADVCRLVQETLADQGPAALRDDEAGQRHLEECSECFAMLEALTALDAGFEAMPGMDAPDQLVESLLRRDELRAAVEMPSARRSWAKVARGVFGPGRPRLKAAMAFAILAVIGLPAYLEFQLRRADAPLKATVAGAALPVADQVRVGDGAPSEPPKEKREQLEALGYVGDGSSEIDELVMPMPPPPPPPPLTQVEELKSYFETPPAEGRSTIVTRDDSNKMQTLDERALPDPKLVQKAGKDAESDQDFGGRKAGGGDDLPKWVGTEANITFRGGSPRIEPDTPGPFDDEDQEARARVRERIRERLRSLPRRNAKPETAPEAEEVDNPELEQQKGGFMVFGIPDAPAVEESPADDSAPALARRFLAERDAVTVPSQPATGYWTNTYVPGDPVLRYLQARLADGSGHGSSVPGAAHQEPPRPHADARRTTQPFDPPSTAALAVQLQSDRSAIEGETRLLVQVGLAGTSRRGGRRPAMNVAVVLDLGSDIKAKTGASLVALAGAFAEARDLGDRFRLIAAGRGGGEMVTPADFRRGPVVVATSGLLAADAPTPAASLSLVEATRLAIGAVARDDDPTAPLGSSAIVLATSRPLGASAEALAELAHESAVAGIPLSVVGVGDAVELTELDRLALAGQGSRRLLREPAGAPGLVDRELAAAGRAVARAVRLRIDLAPGVRLVDVVGARRHSEVGAEQVRQAERAIDLRAARNLGIEADRGDDEAGVLIVIPTFYAGDHHVVLLDVIAAGPGPIADVTARFKDLVQLENSVTSARLDLSRGDGDRGPLERNVLKNLLAHRLRDVLERAGRDLTTPRANVAADGRVAALKHLEAHRQLLVGLGVELAGFDRDPDVARDVAMLEAYAQLLAGRWIDNPERRRYVADSMRYAARLKVLPAPVPVGEAG